MRTQLLKTISVTLAALALTTAPAQADTVTSAHSTPEIGAAACGWDPDFTGAYYNHCNSNVSVVIRVERHVQPGFDRCVRPGQTYLGSLSEIRYAYYIGVLC